MLVTIDSNVPNIARLACESLVGSSDDRASGWCGGLEECEVRAWENACASTAVFVYDSPIAFKYYEKCDDMPDSLTAPTTARFVYIDHRLGNGPLANMLRNLRYFQNKRTIVACNVKTGAHAEYRLDTTGCSDHAIARAFSAIIAACLPTIDDGPVPPDEIIRRTGEQCRRLGTSTSLPAVRFNMRFDVKAFTEGCDESTAVPMDCAKCPA